MDCFFEHGDELSGSVKDGEFLFSLRVLSDSKEGLCSFESVTVIKT